MTHIAILGGGPGGYEAALVAVELGAEVTLVDRDGLGGACVLTDCVPSKTLIATAEAMTTIAASGTLGVRGIAETLDVDMGVVFKRVKTLALSQSLDIAHRMTREGVRVVQGAGRLTGPREITVTRTGGGETVVTADVVLISTGSTPRVVPGAVPDGERILDWQQIYDLPDLPEHLVVVGSGVTGAEFASAFAALGSKVTLVSSRDRVLPGEDSDASAVLEDVFARRGIEVVQGRAAGASRAGTGVEVALADGRIIEASHVLMCVGSIPQTRGLGLEEVGVDLTPSGHVVTDRVSRTTVPGIYAAGDCTGVLALASVAAMQGRIAMWHALGEAVAPLRLTTVASNVFTDPEIATVGVTQAQVESGAANARVVKLPLATNARAKMSGVTDGFVKVFCRPGSGTVLGGVVVGPRASELILPLSMAVQHGITVDQMALTFSIYPSMSGSIVESARQLMGHAER